MVQLDHPWELTIWKVVKWIFTSFNLVPANSPQRGKPPTSPPLDSPSFGSNHSSKLGNLATCRRSQCYVLAWTCREELFYTVYQSTSQYLWLGYHVSTRYVKTKILPDNIFHRICKNICIPTSRSLNMFNLQPNNVFSPHILVSIAFCIPLYWLGWTKLL